MRRRIYIAMLVGAMVSGWAAFGAFNWLRKHHEEARTAQANYWGNEADMIGFFEGAKIPEMELEAAKTLRQRFPGYKVRSFDVAGNELGPNSSKDLRAVHKVTIDFADYDDVATRTILNRESLVTLYEFPNEKPDQPNRVGGGF